MLERLRSAPWWVLTLVLGVYFAVAMTIVFSLTGARIAAAAFGGVLGGAVFGLFMGPLAARRRRHVTRTLSDTAGEPLPVERRRALVRASVRGPVPEDPADRRAVARLARDLLAEQERQRVWVPFFYLVLIALALYFAVNESPLWVLAGLVFGFLLVAWVRGLRRLRERVGLLEAGER